MAAFFISGGSMNNLRIRALIGAAALKVAAWALGPSIWPFIRAGILAHEGSLDEVDRGREGGVITMQWSATPRGRQQAQILEDAARAAMRGARATFEST
jgi:hypothetical protein